MPRLMGSQIRCVTIDLIGWTFAYELWQQQHVDEACLSEIGITPNVQTPEGSSLLLSQTEF